jgi:hypothetical protein
MWQHRTNSGISIARSTSLESKLKEYFAQGFGSDNLNADPDPSF